MTPRSVVVVVLATLLISSMFVPAVALGTGTMAGATTAAASPTTDDWRLEITTRNDPYRTGANNTTRWVNGTVSLVDSEAVDIVEVTLNGNADESFEVPVEKPGTAADGEFNFTITLDRRVNRIAVRGYPNNDTVISDTLVLDGDVLPDTYEREVLGTAPDDPDSNASNTATNEADNGVIDGAEDFDGDELRAIDERRAGTDPLSVDTDDDGLRDGIEARYPEISPTALDGNNDGIPDRLGDLDGDGVDNLAEQEAGTFLHLADTDNDGIPDAEEIDGPTDPTAFDTDGDGISDGVEQEIGTDPTRADSDGDGVVDVNETLTTTAENATLGTTVEVTGVGPVASVTTVRNATRERFNTSVVRAARVGPVRRVEAGVNFSRADVTVAYDEAAVPDGNESDLTLYRQNETLNTFVPLNTSVDAANDRLSATVEEDSTVVAMAQSVWREEFPEQPPAFSRNVTFERYNESACRPGCEVENGTVRYGNASASSNDSSVDEDGPRIDDKDGGEETVQESDVIGGYAANPPDSLPESTGDPLRVELHVPENRPANEPTQLTILHNRNESRVVSYTLNRTVGSTPVTRGRNKTYTYDFGRGFDDNMTAIVELEDGTTARDTVSFRMQPGRTPDVLLEGPARATIDNDTGYYAPTEEYGSATTGFEWLVDGRDVENDACNGCIGSRRFEYDFLTEGTHTVTHIQEFENGDSVRKSIEVYVESSGSGTDTDAPTVDLDGPGRAQVDERVSYLADASDSGEIVNYNWSVRRPDGRWFNGIGDNATTYGGVVSRPGEYVIEVAVTDSQGNTGTARKTLTAESESSPADDPPSVDLRGPSFAVEGDNVSYYAAAEDEDGIRSYDWRVQRPNGYWYDPGGDDSATYGGVIDAGYYTMEVTVTDNAGESTTVQQTVLGFGADTGLATKRTRTVTEEPIQVQSGTDSTVVEARVRGEASEGYATLTAVGESGTREVFAVSADGAGEKDWRTVEAELAEFDGENVTLRAEWTDGAEVQVDNVRVTRDWDGDGLSNSQELIGMANGQGIRFKTDPYDSDTDGDGLSDSTEVGPIETRSTLDWRVMDTYPVHTDSDNDQLNDSFETNSLTSPTNPDTDYDGYIDSIDPSPRTPDIGSNITIRSGNYNEYIDVYVENDAVPIGDQEFNGVGYYQDQTYNAIRNANAKKVSGENNRYKNVYRVDVERYPGISPSEPPERYYVNVSGSSDYVSNLEVTPRNESSELDKSRAAATFVLATATTANPGTPFISKRFVRAGVKAGAGADTGVTGILVTTSNDPASTCLRTCFGLASWSFDKVVKLYDTEAQDGEIDRTGTNSVPVTGAKENFPAGSTDSQLDRVVLPNGFEKERLYSGEYGFGWKTINDETAVTSANDILSVVKSTTYYNQDPAVTHVMGPNSSGASTIVLQIRNRRVITARSLVDRYSNKAGLDYPIVLTEQKESKIISERNGVQESNAGTIQDVIEDTSRASNWTVYREISNGGRYSYIWMAVVDGKLWTVRGRLDSKTGSISVQSANRKSEINIEKYKNVVEQLGYTPL